MNKKAWSFFGACIFTIAVIVGIKAYHLWYQEKNAGNAYENIKEEHIIDEKDKGKISENPIDFSEIQKKYPDVYAWVRIPNTGIDYPIVQHMKDNSFYLNHGIDSKENIEGAIYTENYNARDFQDANTVIYGHNMKNGSMFRGLHNYKDKAFFDKYREIIIFMPGKILYYQIFAAYTYDDRHLLQSFDFADDLVFESYINNIMNQKSMNSVVDRERDIETDDKIITLSTCTGNSKERYLVQAVLVSVEEE